LSWQQYLTSFQVVLWYLRRKRFDKQDIHRIVDHFLFFRSDISKP
jgi:hypothetical protein